MPPENFRLYAVSTRFPQQKSLVAGLNLELATLEAISRQPVKQIVPGVYEINCVTNMIRLIVTSEISKQKHNALWHLYSGVADNGSLWE